MSRRAGEMDREALLTTRNGAVALGEEGPGEPDCADFRRAWALLFRGLRHNWRDANGALRGGKICPIGTA